MLAMFKGFRVFALGTVLLAARSAAAQQPPAPAAPLSAPATSQPALPAAGSNPTTICGQPIPPPASLPPAGSGPVLYLIAPCWEAQGNQTVIEPATYLYYIQLKPSSPSQGVWVPYDETTEKSAIDDFHRLWNTNFLDNLWVDVTDYTFSNGVIGKRSEERRVGKGCRSWWAWWR